MTAVITWSYNQPITVMAGSFPLDSKGWEAITYAVHEDGPAEEIGRVPIVDARFSLATPPGWTGRFQVVLSAPDGVRMIGGEGELVAPLGAPTDDRG